MRIGVDARLLSQSLTGIGRYTHELSRHLLANGADLKFYSPIPPLECNRIGDIAQWAVGGCTNRLSSMLWFQSNLPRILKMDMPDVYWATTHRIPRFFPKPIARVVTIHDLAWKFAGETMKPLSRVLDRSMMPYAVSMADRIIAISNSTASDIEAEFPEARGKVRVVYPAPTRMGEPRAFEILAAFGIDRPYFLFVGTIEPRKNLPRLLRAFASLSSEVRKNVLMVITGAPGWRQTEMRHLLDRNDLKNNVVVTGYVSESELATLYSHARFLAMPSLYEGFGLPLAESLSFGVPVLASNSSSMPEVVGQAGLLVDPLSEACIARGLSKMLHDNAGFEFFKANALLQAEKFSWERAAKQTHAVFIEALAERSGSNPRGK